MLEQSQQRLLAHAEPCPEDVRRERCRRAPDERECALAEGIGRQDVVADEAGRRPRAGVLDAELQTERRRARRRAVLDAELERGVGSDAAQVEIGVSAIPISG